MQEVIWAQPVKKSSGFDLHPESPGEPREALKQGSVTIGLVGGCFKAAVL